MPDLLDNLINEDNGLKTFFKPLADRMRPADILHIYGQEHLLAEGKPLNLLIKAGLTGSIILWGPPGCGKTTLAEILAKTANAEFIKLSAVTSGVKDLKAVFEQAKLLQKHYKKRTILFVDEIHRFNKAQQDALLPYVESGTVIFIGATTENPSFEVNSALLSRCRVLVLKPLDDIAIQKVLMRAITEDEQLKRKPEILIDKEVVEVIAEFASGDARVALNVLEVTSEAARQANPYKPVINKELVLQTFQHKALHYDKSGENHYDLISALHKSLRGSDPDAALYWLYRMLLAGENCRFVLRRMIRFASEDVGMADPFALTLAVSAAQAFDYIGIPEGYLTLAHLAVYLACAPKSNALYSAEKSVKKYIESEGANKAVPLHLRNAPTKLMHSIGYGKEYKYPHNFKGNFVKQNYFAEDMQPKTFYIPGKNGKEMQAKLLLQKLWPERYKKDNDSKK